MKPEITKTFMLDIGRFCNLKSCLHCYYRSLGDLRLQGFEDIDFLKKKADDAISRGCTYCDVTGGETTAYPQITELIKYLKNRNVRTCLITNGLMGAGKIRKIIDAGVDEFLISIHGTAKINDMIMGLPGARCKQNRFIEQIDNAGVKYRFNFVIMRFNQRDIVQTVEYMLKWHPHIINFINFNPHGEWASNFFEGKRIIADLRIVRPFLEKAVDIIEAAEIGVNVRYYPICMIDEKYRRVICNDLHVGFDPYEWREGLPNNYDVVREHWRNVSMNIEEHSAPCRDCDLQNICGGVNKAFHYMSKKIYGEYFQPIKNEKIKNKDDFYFYRKFNEMTLKKR